MIQSRDPDLLNLGHGKRFDEFPMTRGRFVKVIYFCFLVAPLRFVRYQLAYLEVNTLGQGKNVYLERARVWKALAGTVGSGWGRCSDSFISSV